MVDLVGLTGSGRHLTLPAFNVAEVRQAARELMELGFEYVDMGSRGHPLFQHPDYGKYSLALTPRNPGLWLKGFRSNLARQLGITKAELERQLGVYQPKREGPKVRRERNDAGRQARRFHVVRDEAPRVPVRRGTPQERMQEIVRDREAAEARQLRAAPDSPAYMCALDDIARCRREWLEAEAALKEAA